MDKARKKELLKAYADQQRQSFKDSLPAQTVDGNN